MSSDRLKELQRQRALVHEHLTWLDGEISRESAGRPAKPQHIGTPIPVAVAPATSTPSLASDADGLIEHYQSRPGSLRSEVKRGCYVYFVGAFLLLALGLVALWFIFRVYPEIVHRPADL